MNLKQIKFQLITSELTNKPSGSRTNKFNNLLKSYDKNYQYTDVKNILKNVEPRIDDVFDALYYQLPNECDELIPRKLWDFSSLRGYDKSFLKQNLFEFSFDLILKDFEPKHEILVVLEPFRKKPYIDNTSYQFINGFTDKADFVVASEIGIVPLYPKDYSNLYPFRYFTYVKSPNSKSPLKYNTKKLKSFITDKKYKFVFFVGAYQTFNSYMHDLYFNISMDCNVNTDWVWSLHENLWYQISANYGSVVGFTYTNAKAFTDLFNNKMNLFCKWYK